VIIEEKAKLFVCAIGVPPKDVVEKLHKAGILVMNVSYFLLLRTCFLNDYPWCRWLDTQRWDRLSHSYGIDRAILC
jgi:NAD(P)H-dependent flavin oxidoreductase YrpB (nitropropane dioxygenase family)